MRAAKGVNITMPPINDYLYKTKFCLVQEHKNTLYGRHELRTCWESDFSRVQILKNRENLLDEVYTLYFIFIFFLSGFSFTNILDSQDGRGRRGLSL